MKVVMVWYDPKTMLDKRIERKVPWDFAFNAAKKVLDSKRKNYKMFPGTHLGNGNYMFVAHSPDGKTSVKLWVYKDQ